MALDDIIAMRDHLSIVTDRWSAAFNYVIKMLFAIIYFSGIAA